MKLRHRPLPTPTAEAEPPSVRLVFVPPPRGEAEEGACFLVQDAHGAVHSTGSSSRRAALRELGGLAMRGLPAPLILLNPDGSPTGDRLA
ncbi:MAG: hypothetical protein JWN31_897 [Frankiales bacterium]|nr:hypothetical protein [Frankiales bacterium]